SSLYYNFSLLLLFTPLLICHRIFFFFNDTATTEIYTLSLHDALPIFSKQQQVSEIMRQMLTQAQTAGQYFTNHQIKEMTRKVSAEVDLVHQQTQNQRYGSSHIRSEERFSRNAETDLVCRLLLEKKKKTLKKLHITFTLHFFSMTHSTCDSRHVPLPN